jgi:UDP:flavonoid glycosyltransferase YjiC (YdhE family)
MRALIAAIGGRGDVAPFTGLGTAIRAAGHSVTITSTDEYESLVVGCGLEFQPLPGTHGVLEDPRWLQDSSGPVAAVRLIRLLSEHLRVLHTAIQAVARQEAADVLALTGMTTFCGTASPRDWACPRAATAPADAPDLRLPAFLRNGPVLGPAGEPRCRDRGLGHAGAWHGGAGQGDQA